MDAWALRHRRWFVLLAPSFLVVAVALLVYEQKVGPLPGELPVVDRVYDRRDKDWLIEAFRPFVDLALPSAVVVAVVVVGWFTWRIAGLRWAIAAPLALVAPLVARIVKTSTGPTDVAVQVQGLGLDAAGSLPSGHAAYVAAMFGFVAALGLSRGRWDVAAAAAVPIVGMGPATIINGAHYPGDILAGWALGLGWVCTLLLVIPLLGRRGQASAAP